MTSTTALALSDGEAAQLTNCERIIERGINTFATVGDALWQIREQRLYRATHATMDAYLRERWGMSRQHASRQIHAAATARALRDSPILSPIGDKVGPTNEAQTRPLPRDNPDKAAQIWDKAVQKAGGQPTAKQVAEAATEFREPRASSSRAALTSSESNEWYTPEQYLEAVREMFGGVIDVDPASCDVANERVKATRWIGLPRDGLKEPWGGGRGWLNPPYGTNDERRSNQGVWLTEAIQRVDASDVDTVAFLCNAHIGRKWLRQIWDYPVVMFDERIRFVRPDGTPGDQPTHGNVLALLTRDVETWRGRFTAAMRPFGVVALPRENGVVEVTA